MAVFSAASFNEHEAVHHFCDPGSGLQAIIAVHSTALGPAAGGCRRWQYARDDDALHDALRLSRGMTFKNAVAGLPFGGGKAVILASGEQTDSDALFAAFGRCVNDLNGKYITAEDVGVSVANMRVVREHTPFVSGLEQQQGAAGGDPSPLTAYGVYLAIKAAVKYKHNHDSLRGLRIAVQGVGNVGYHLCELLHADGASLIVADVNATNIERVRNAMPVTVVPATEILATPADVLAPCALGAVLNEQSIAALQTDVIVGAANNQLAYDTDGALLVKRGVLYAPDYVTNAGGIISCTSEYLGTGSAAQVRAAVERIPVRLLEIFEQADAQNKATNVVADALARAIVAGEAS